MAATRAICPLPGRRDSAAANIVASDSQPPGFGTTSILNQKSRISALSGTTQLFLLTIGTERLNPAARGTGKFPQRGKAF